MYVSIPVSLFLSGLFFTLFASSFGSVSPFQLLSISPGLPPRQICASLLLADREEEEEEGGG